MAIAAVIKKQKADLRTGRVAQFDATLKTSAVIEKSKAQLKRETKAKSPQLHYYASQQPLVVIPGQPQMLLSVVQSRRDTIEIVEQTRCRHNIFGYWAVEMTWNKFQWFWDAWKSKKEFVSSSRCRVSDKLKYTSTAARKALVKAMERKQSHAPTKMYHCEHCNYYHLSGKGY